MTPPHINHTLEAKLQDSSVQEVAQINATSRWEEMCRHVVRKGEVGVIFVIDLSILLIESLISNLNPLLFLFPLLGQRFLTFLIFMSPGYVSSI